MSRHYKPLLDEYEHVLNENPKLNPKSRQVKINAANRLLEALVVAFSTETLTEIVGKRFSGAEYPRTIFELKHLAHDRDRSSP